MKSKLLSGLFVFILLFILSSQKSFADVKWWGCSIDPLEVKTTKTYVVSYEHEFPLTSYTVGDKYENPLYWIRNNFSTYWDGPFHWYGPAIRFYTDSSIKEGINQNLPIALGWASQVGNLEVGFEWVPESDFTLTKVEFLSSDPGAFNVRVMDGGEMPGSILSQCVVSQAIPPTANAGGPYFGEEGSSVTFDASSSSDSDGTIVKYEWDLDGDGVYETQGVKVEKTWSDDYSGTIRLRVTDDQGLNSVETTTVNVSNVSPTVEAGPDAVAASGQEVSFNGTFTDPGDDTHTITWKFGDGTQTEGTLTPSHVFYKPGTYTVELEVKDDDGGVGSDTLQVKVNPVPAYVNFDPDTLSLDSNGKVVTVYIYPPYGYSAVDIDPSSLKLNDSVSSNSKPVTVTDYNGDGIPDFMVKFDRTDVEQILQVGDSVEVRINGSLKNGIYFEGKDLIRVI